MNDALEDKKTKKKKKQTSGTEENPQDITTPAKPQVKDGMGMAANALNLVSPPQIPSTTNPEDRKKKKPPTHQKNPLSSAIKNKGTSEQDESDDESSIDDVNKDKSDDNTDEDRDLDKKNKKQSLSTNKPKFLDPKKKGTPAKGNIYPQKNAESDDEPSLEDSDEDDGNVNIEDNNELDSKETSDEDENSAVKEMKQLLEVDGKRLKKRKPKTSVQ